MSSARATRTDGAGRSRASGERAARTPSRDLPMLEWIVGAIGALLVGGTIAFLVYHALARDETAPDVRVVEHRVLALEDRYLVQFRAFNQGGSAAAELTIEGELTGPDGSAETSEAVLDYVPARSSREGGLWFSGDPRAGRLTLRATGYAEP
jgi:uncharacterized protein (TIGR02588 family)